MGGGGRSPRALEEVNLPSSISSCSPRDVDHGLKFGSGVGGGGGWAPI